MATSPLERSDDCCDNRPVVAWIPPGAAARAYRERRRARASLSDCTVCPTGASMHTRRHNRARMTVQRIMVLVGGIITQRTDRHHTWKYAREPRACQNRQSVASLRR